ncbi:flagellar biosynthetic protein FliO [Salinisphaera aquimarina]|uniref:Flagellar protein n=1 Tax=Salinisphaera aquimarina TaxID=2094031 RepID=A0ABV7EN88_9GAMM
MTAAQVSPSAETAQPGSGAPAQSHWLHKPPVADNAQTGQASPAFAPTAPGVGAGTLGRTSVGLIVVIGIILLCAWLLKRFSGARGHNAETLTVVASRGIGQRERVVVVEIEDKWLVLGVTPHSINTLHTLDAQPAPAAHDGHPPSFGTAFAHNLKQATARFSRRPER